MKYLFLIFRIPAAITFVVASFFVILTAHSTLANEQQRWTGHIDNQAYLDQYYGRSSEIEVSTYGGSSTGYSHRAGYGGLTTIIVERPRQDCPNGVEYRYGNTVIFYCNGYRPNYYDDPYRRVYVSPRYYRPGYPYYRPGYPKYKKHYYKHDKYNKRYHYKHDRPRYGKPFDNDRHRHKYVAPNHPGYKSRHNPQYRQNRIVVPRKNFPTRGGSYRQR